MKIIHTAHVIDGSVLFLKDYMKDGLLFDIETTGFSPAKDLIYLIGTGALTSEHDLLVTQYLAETPADEAEIIHAFRDDIEGKSSLISFNGKAFDVPFVEKRAAFHGRPVTLPPSIDLFREAKKIDPVFPMKGRSLKAIEPFFGIFREDTMSGGDLIDWWKQYCVSGDPDIERTLLLHNGEDVADLFPLLEILEMEGLLQPGLSVERFSASDMNSIIFAGKSGIRALSPFSVRDDRALFRFDGDSCKGTIFYETGPKKYFLPDYRSYCYLIEEGTLLPKVLASAVPKEFKRSVKAREAFIETDGAFFFLPPDRIPEGEKVYRDDWESRKLFIKKDPQEAEDWLSSYADLYLSYIFTK